MNYCRQWTKEFPEKSLPVNLKALKWINSINRCQPQAKRWSAFSFSFPTEGPMKRALFITQQPWFHNGASSPSSLYSESPLYISLNPGPSALPSPLAAIPCDHARTHVNKTASNCPHWSCWWCCCFAAVGYIRCNWSWCRGDKATLTLSPISAWCHTHGRPLSCLPPIVVDGRQMGWGGVAAWRHGGMVHGAWCTLLVGWSQAGRMAVSNMQIACGSLRFSPPAPCPPALIAQPLPITSLFGIFRFHWVLRLQLTRLYHVCMCVCQGVCVCVYWLYMHECKMQQQKSI